MSIDIQDPKITAPIPEVPKTSWALRRAYLYIVTVFCMLVPAYCIGTELDTDVANTATTFAFVTLITNTMTYVFGSATETLGLLKMGKR